MFNCNNSKCISFSPGCKLDISDMYLGASTIKWCHTIKYLGVTLLPGPHMKVDIDVLKRKFFASCNCKGQTELVRLSLVESYCLPILQYCCAAYKLSVVQALK